MRAIGRPFIGNSSIAKKSSIAISAFVFASAAAVLLPTGASAQINIGGLIQGALQQRGYPYGYHPPSHSSSSSSSHHDSDSDDDSAADNKNGKGIKSTNDNDSGSQSGGGAHDSGSGNGQSASTDTPPKSGPSGGGSAGGSSGAPAKTSDDMPSFAPSR
jgi:hypothetical protein